MTIIIARHGETMNNLPDPSLHTVDPDLNARGLAQARLLGERFAGVHIDALIASPLLRALRTAHELSIRKNNMPVRVLHELVEIGTDYTTLTHAGALEICPAALPFEHIPIAGDYGDGYALEIRDEYYSLARAHRVISLLRQFYPEDSTVLLVGHGAFNQRLIAAALRTSFPPDFIFSQDNTGVSAVNYRLSDDCRRPGDDVPRPGGGKREVTRLVMMNDTSHLYGVSL